MTETVQERLQPEGLPSDWTYDRASHTVTCGGCMFRFGAEHFTADTEDACPVCSENTLIKERDEARAKAISECAAIAKHCVGKAMALSNYAEKMTIVEAIPDAIETAIALLPPTAPDSADEGKAP